jgi:hypothetical protein
MAELICPKCGIKYYGVGCPTCDYPPVPPDKGLAQDTVLFGFIFLAMGLFIASIHFFEHSFPFIAVIAGLTFALAGFQVLAVPRLYKQDSRLSASVFGLLLAGMAYLCLFAAFSKGRVSGGIPFILPDKWNQRFGHFVFGVIGCGIASWSLWLFYRVIKPPPKKKSS